MHIPVFTPETQRAYNDLVNTLKVRLMQKKGNSKMTSRDDYQNKVCHKDSRERCWRNDKDTIERTPLIKTRNYSSRSSRRKRIVSGTKWKFETRTIASFCRR